MLWKWLTVLALSMTPALVLGQTAAATAGIAWNLDARLLVAVMALGGFLEGMLVAWLGGVTTRIGFIHRLCEKMRKPRAVKMANAWGPWGGLMVGVAVFGQEPILLALRFLGVDLKRLALPVAVSNMAYALIYYAVVRFGLDKLMSVKL